MIRIRHLSIKVVLIIMKEVTIQETLETQKGENPFSVVMMIFKGTIAMISRGIDQILERLTKVSQIQCDLNVASLRAENKTSCYQLIIMISVKKKSRCSFYQPSRKVVLLVTCDT